MNFRTFAKLITTNEKVMLHTFMDSLREDGNRQINHHGKMISIGESKKNEETNVEEAHPTYKDMTQRNEKELVEARKVWYDHAETKRMNALKFAEFASKKGIPIVIFAFATLYWSYGLFYFFNPTPM